MSYNLINKKITKNKQIMYYTTIKKKNIIFLIVDY